jgi:hypothetical protein
MKNVSRNTEAENIFVVYSVKVKHKVNPVVRAPHSVAFENCMLSSMVNVSSVDGKKWSPFAVRVSVAIKHKPINP